MEILLLTIINVVSRLLPHAANMTAVGAIALFSGAKFGWKKGILVTVLSMILTDAVLGFHSVMWATYGCMIVSVIIGTYIGKTNHVRTIVSASLFSSIVFFLVTNFAVWISPWHMYPHTVSGLVECYIMALPFFRNSLVGDIGYTTVLFGLYGFIVSKQLSFIYRRNQSK